MTAVSMGPEGGGANRNKILAVIGGAVVLVVGGLLYLQWASGRVEDDIATREARAQEAVEAFEESAGDTLAGAADAESTPADEGDPVADVDPLLAPGEILVINRVPGDDYGRLAIRHVDGSRTLLDRRCLRVHVAADNGICLAEDEAVLVPAFRTVYFDASTADLTEVRSYSSPLPSRARMAPSGEIATATAFISGSSYADIGGEAETIAIIDSVEDRNNLVGLLQFEVLAPEARYEAADRQFWGVSFATDDEFWVTGYFGQEPEVLRGSVSRRTLDITGFIGSCPSISPDGEHLVYKESQPDGSYVLVAVELATGETWPVGETRSVDDQVEWLDDDTILYALHPDGAEPVDGVTVQPQFDIWSIDIAPGSEPELFLPAADSPAVPRS